MNPDLTIVLLGNSGVGKSASGNTILGRAAFESRQSFTPVTEHICEASADVFGTQISVIDTPAILGSKREIIQSWCQELLQSSRPCLFLLVFSVGRFSREQVRAVEAAIRVLGDQGTNNCYLLFTGGDVLQDRSLEDFIFGDQERSQVATAFSGRLHLFNNKSGEREQVRELLEKSGHLRTHQDPPADVSRSRRIILLGRPGGGKSSSGNTIQGSNQFKSVSGFDSVSTETVCKSASVEGRQVSVVDTPGFTDEVQTLTQLYNKIRSSLVKASPGPHVFIIVVRISTISTADIQLFELLQILFDSDVCDAFKYSMILFTHGDELEDEFIDEKIRSNRHVSDLVSMCAGRFCVLNNRDKTNRQQVRDLLDQIDEMVTDNGGQHFTSDMFRMTQSGGGGKVWERICRFFIDHKKQIIRAMMRVMVISTFVGAAAGAGKLGVGAAKVIAAAAGKLGIGATKATPTAKLGAVVGAAAGAAIDGVIIEVTAAYAAFKKD